MPSPSKEPNIAVQAITQQAVVNTLPPYPKSLPYTSPDSIPSPRNVSPTARSESKHPSHSRQHRRKRSSGNSSKHPPSPTSTRPTERATSTDIPTNTITITPMCSVQEYISVDTKQRTAFRPTPYLAVQTSIKGSPSWFGTDVLLENVLRPQRLRKLRDELSTKGVDEFHKTCRDQRAMHDSDPSQCTVRDVLGRLRKVTVDTLNEMDDQTHDELVGASKSSGPFYEIIINPVVQDSAVGQLSLDDSMFYVSTLVSSRERRRADQAEPREREGSFEIISFHLIFSEDNPTSDTSENEQTGQNNKARKVGGSNKETQRAR